MSSDPAETLRTALIKNPPITLYDLSAVDFIQIKWGRAGTRQTKLLPPGSYWILQTQAGKPDKPAMTEYDFRLRKAVDDMLNYALAKNLIPPKRGQAVDNPRLYGRAHHVLACLGALKPASRGRTSEWLMDRNQISKLQKDIRSNATRPEDFVRTHSD